MRLNLRGIQRVVILGGGTAGWFSALEMRSVFGAHVQVVVIESQEIGIVGVGEGGILNLMECLQRHHINLAEFVQETDAAYKLGFRYERWRTGESQDAYYHMFPIMSPELAWKQDGYFPILSATLNNGIDVSAYMDSVRLTDNQCSQDDVSQELKKSTANFGFSYHFDSHKLGKYLKRIALSRGIQHIEGLVEEVLRDPDTGDATHVKIKNQADLLPVDFMIDASGFSRVVIGRAYKSRWLSFSKILLMNSAIPFHTPHPEPNPCLVTRSIAMKSGWMWKIPLQSRIGAGYVFNRDFITDEQAVQEIEETLGCEIEPMRTLHFEPGCYEEVWQGNVVAVGLASGFVEPLEATSIGQMLEQVTALGKMIRDTQGVITQSAISFMNRQNVDCWYGIRDFLRMHYDSPRRDTALWRAIAQADMSDHYRELKVCWQQRTPREIDFVDYEMNGWQLFGVLNWLPIGVAMGVMPAEATVPELLSLQPEQRQRLAHYIAGLRQRLSAH